MAYIGPMYDPATIAAQQAAEKAASGKVAGPAPPPALTAEQRQANIARDLALSQVRGARPSGQDSQFYQPAYQPQYNNYVNPLLSGNVAAYGTNPGASAGYMAAMAPGGQGLSNYYQSLQQLSAQQSNQPYGMDYATFNPARKAMGASQNDLMAAYGYAQQPMQQMQTPFSYQQPAQQMNWQTGQTTQSGNTLTPELARTLMQRSMTTGLPKSESDKYGGYAAVKAMYDKSGGDYSGNNAPYPQQQQQQQAQFNPYTNSYSSVSNAPQMQTPFSYQQPAAQLQNPFSYQTTTGQPNKDYGLAYSKPMQLPQYVYDTIRDVDSYQSQPVQAYQSTSPAPVTSSGPSKAIVGRSSQIRGTPNVMAAPVTKAKGGIVSLLKKHK